MQRRALGWFLICAGVILLAGQLAVQIGGDGPAVLLALGVGAGLYAVFGR